MQKTKSIIENLDVEHYAKVLKSLGVRDESITTMKITSSLLRLGVARGLTLFDIASIICRENLEKPSKLEVMCQKASQTTSTNDNGMDESFLERLCQILDQE